MIAFSYDEAFSRNIGWVTAAEQQILRRSRVAIAGLGGTGGSIAITLARLGVGAFHLADFDTFALANFNRQAGAVMSTLDRAKIDVIADTVRAINPDADIVRFTDGVTAANVEAFFSGVAVYMDNLDFFAFDARQLVYSRCAQMRIPTVMVAPLGMGAAMVNFEPGGMTFDEYFGWPGASELEKAMRFVVGLSPAMLQRTYLADATRVRLDSRAGPSTGMACQICSGVAATEALKILLKRGRVCWAPRAVQFDAYRHRIAHTWRPGGFRNPLQQLMLAYLRRRLRKL